MNYEEFVRSKTHSTGSFGFEPVWMPESAFDFQSHIIGKAVRKGRIGLFEDTGRAATPLRFGRSSAMKHGGTLREMRDV